jgi:glycosyltransferase involved in cell wall biosynthesis
MNTLPSVSVIIPTGYGDKYFPVALECFLSQKYKGQLEIIVVDNNDGGKTVESLLPLVDGDAKEADIIAIKYLLCDREPVGALRNIGTSYASGDICVTGDEDDWSSPDRVAAQVERLRVSGKAVTGWHNLLFWNESEKTGYKYFFEPGRAVHSPYACGTSQAYLRSWWVKHPFQETGIEDYLFQKEALDHGQLDSTDAGQLGVARAHADSKCPPRFGCRQFPSVEHSAFPPAFFEAIKFLPSKANNASQSVVKEKEITSCLTQL